MSLIINLAKGMDVSDMDIVEELTEICDRVHAQCNDECPIYEINGGPVNTVRGKMDESLWEDAWACFALRIESIRSVGGVQVTAMWYTDCDGDSYWAMRFVKKDGSIWWC